MEKTQQNGADTEELEIRFKPLNNLYQKIEERLIELIPQSYEGGKRIQKAMQYSLLHSGKRLRPLLSLIVAKGLNVPQKQVMDVACAVELLHTASLILDDLPCMDNAAQRRGKPANHVAFGENVALLSAISMISHAYLVVAQAEHCNNSIKPLIIALLSKSIGVEGLSGGQEMDLYATTDGYDLSTIKRMHKKKTSALFVAAMEIGILLAEDNSSADDSRVKSLRQYGYHLGCAFQVFDDLLDVLGNRENMGKDRDQDAGKKSLTELMSLQDIKDLAQAECDAATRALTEFGEGRELFDLYLEMIVCAYQKQLL